MPRCRGALAGGLAALCAAGCGGPAAGGSRRAAASGPCSAAARAAIAGATGTPAVTGASFTAASGAPGCRFAAPRPGARPVGVVATIDSAPQAYVRLERQAVEYSQNVIWAHEKVSAYPQNVPGLGVDADWFPADRRLLATDGSRLVEVSVTWPGAAAGQERRLAEDLARGYVAGA